MATDDAQDRARRLIAFLDRLRDVPAAAWAISTGAVTMFAAYYTVVVPQWPVPVAIGVLIAVVLASVVAAGAYAIVHPSRSDRMLSARRDYEAGSAALEDKRYREAIELFERAAVQDECYLHLSKYGRVCLRLGRYDDAIRLLTRCHDLAPTSGLRRTARRNRGVAFMITRQWGAALTDFGEYLAANQKESVIRRQRALVHLARGEMSEAETDAREAVANASSRSAPHATLAVVLARLGQLDVARRLLDKANKLKPETPNALYALSQANVALGDLDEAYRRLETAVQLDSRFAPRAHLDPFLEPLMGDDARFARATRVTEWKLLGMLKDEA